MHKVAIALKYSLTGYLVNLLFANCVLAQINPDETLGTERSSLVQNVEIRQGVRGDRIQGGATRGSNLFHSFREFNINEGQRVYFNNPTGITNIISRVTGTNPSNLLGTLGVNGSANLFFINPKGIIFGQNARLDVGGSFVASTANAIQFGNQELFSNDNPNIPGLLTINPSALLFNKIGAIASIQNNSTAPAGLDLAGIQASGLRVPNGRSLLLVGGNITMDRGGLNAFDGRVELGGLASSGTVGLQVKNNSLSLSFVDGVTRADTTLTHGAGIYVDGATGGNIAINARNLSILEESLLSAGIGQGLGSPNTQAGDITLNATEAIRLEQSSGIENLVSRNGTGNGGDIIISSAFLSITNSVLNSSTSGRGNAGRISLKTSDSISIAGNAAIFSGVEATGIGKGGNIDIRAASFSVEDGAQLQSAIFVDRAAGYTGQGDAGDIDIKVTGALEIKGLNELPSGIYSLVSTGGRGNGGNITISAKSVNLLDGANIFANNNGLGNAGRIQINATDFVNISGASATRGDSSEISTRTRSSGKGGDIIINTPNFKVSNGAIVNAETRSDGNGGNITVNARRVEAINGGQLFSTTRGRGNAGKIAVTATDRITIDGIDTTLGDRINKYAQSNQTRGILNLANGASGFYVLSLGSGRAGDIELTSSKIQLDNTGRLIAESASGDGGNITLKGGDVLLLRRGSFISATAGITGATAGNGGNINVKTNFIVTVPQENSDITANAFEGSGGQVNITAQGIFGLYPRSRQELQTLLRTEKPEDIDPRKLSSNDITAISQKNPSLSGQVITNTPDTDPTQALVQLPVDIIDVTGLINQNLCVAANRGSEFTITGRGGWVPSPYEALNPDASWEDWRMVQQQALTEKTGSVRNNQQDRDELQSTNIIEAQGWVMSANGTVILTAEPVVVTPQGTWLSPLDCHLLRANL